MGNKYLNGGKLMKTGNRVFLTVTATLMIGMLWVSVAYAWNEVHLQRLKATKTCPNCDLSGADLSGANLSGADLSGANLSNANLGGANLTSANLSNANLYGANLKNANLSNANLGGANLSWAIWTDGTTCGVGSIGMCKKCMI